MNITGLLIGIGVAIVLGYLIYNSYSRQKIMEKLLKTHYINLGFEVTYISSLKMHEKIKYGVPISPFMTFCTIPFNIFISNQDSFFRKLETVDKDDNEQMRYIEVNMDGQTVNIKEFEIYNF